MFKVTAKGHVVKHNTASGGRNAYRVFQHVPLIDWRFASAVIRYQLIARMMLGRQDVGFKSMTMPNG